MKRWLFALITVTFIPGSLHLFGQARGAAPAGGGQRGAAPQAPPTAKAMAPWDITGYWVSEITEDWRWRMFPNKQDYAGIPLGPEGKRIADMWDPAKDEAAGEQCKGYGAPVIMRNPGRFRFTWADDQTLKIEADMGTQTRMLYFGNPQGQGGDWQGVSKAEWDPGPPANAGFGGGRGRGSGPVPASLKVVTTKMKPGYIRRNGVPYSANAVLTEWYDFVREANGDIYLVQTQEVNDPMYLTDVYTTAMHLKKQADATGFKPTPCASKQF
jgi:hypothetical protein